MRLSKKRELLKKNSKGKADGGALFIVTTCMSIICLALAFVGGNLPSKFPKSNKNISDIGNIKSLNSTDRNTLQLYMIEPKPAKLIPTIDPKAPPLSSDRTTTQGSDSGGGYVSASTNTCGGKYNLSKLPEQKNFGDPNCTFTKDKLFTMLKQLDAKNASLWYLTIVPGESSYNPNARAAPVGAQLKLDAGGAWGLFQMGSSTPPYQAPPAAGKNGKLDRGDVNWELQAANAVGYNKTKACDFRYWATAKAYWGKLSC